MLNGCHSWIRAGGFRDQNGRLRVQQRTLQIAGRPSDVTNVRYLFAWLTAEIDRLARKSGQGRAWLNSFRLGAALGAVKAMEAARQQVRAESTSTALARVDSRADEARKAAPEMNRQKSGSASIGDPRAFRAGEAAGRALHMGAKLGTADGSKLLGSK
jgi:hypothetical protein